MEGEALVRAFRALFQSEGGAEERWLLAQSRDWGIKLIAEQLAHFESVSQWGVLDQMRAVVEAVGDIEVLLDIIEKLMVEHPRDDHRTASGPAVLRGRRDSSTRPMRCSSSRSTRAIWFSRWSRHAVNPKPASTSASSSPCQSCIRQRMEWKNLIRCSIRGRAGSR